MTDEPDIEALAKRFFDCVEAGDIEGLVACYAPGARIWHNTDGQEQTPAENAATLRGFVQRISNRRYTERLLHAFAGGFVQQHRLTGVRGDGVPVALSACIVCTVSGGKITRLDEYFNSAQVAEFRKPV